MHLPKTIEQLNALIVNRVQENLHLDYKESAAIGDRARGEIAKDVSAFANSDSGVIVYGMIEKDHLPIRIDDGIDDRKFNREWLENVITSNVSPRIDGLEIYPIPLAELRSAYVIEIPKSSRGPHQESVTKRYYKRFNFKSEPMEDYEIRDVRNRRDVVEPLLSIDVEMLGWIMYFVVKNIGDIAAEDVSFRFTPAIPEELNKIGPTILTRGCKFLPPRKSFRFFIGTGVEAVNEATCQAFDVEVTYTNRRFETRVSDLFHISTLDYLQTAIIHSDVHEQTEKLEKQMTELTRSISEISGVLQDISSVAGPSGLAISTTALRNLDRLRRGDANLERIDANSCRSDAFREVLGVSTRTANLLHHYFRFRHAHGESLEDAATRLGLTSEGLALLKERFTIDD